MIYYICHYSCEEIEEEQRKVAPAAQYKASYIIDALSSSQFSPVEVISPCITELKKIVKGSKKIIKDNVVLKTFLSINSTYKIPRYLGYLITNVIFIFYLFIKIKKNDKVIVYHSLSLMKIIRLLKRVRKCEIIIEVEEIYSDVTNNAKKRREEIAYFKVADKYIFITDLLNNEINTSNKPFAISHGSYNSIEQHEDVLHDKNIHVVYAGTFDPRKGGVFAAIKATEFLSTGYHIHILGFGNEENTNKVKQAIEDVAKKTSAIISYEGHLQGDDYTRFLQKCDIGLSTQDPHGAFNASSFPSKILSYMANGLRVVSVRIPAIETSDIGQYMYFYNNQTPEKIAEAIMSIDMKDNYDGRQIIKELDDKFKEDFKRILG